MNNLLLQSLLVAIISFSTGCKTEKVADDKIDNPNASWQLTSSFDKLSFNDPVELVNSGDGTNRIFVVEQGGSIKSFKNEADVASSDIFLDIKSKVNAGGEKGLLGLAFHPNFKSNGQFFVNYTRTNKGNLETVIARYQSDGKTATAGSEEILLTYEQPYSNHNGGKIMFGQDGFLYIGAGDGGSGGDPKRNGQNLNTLLGKILRIDVDKKANGLNYGIPANNPFVSNNNARPEIFAYGIRNPWKMNVDRKTGKIWLADVGQNTKEEINIVTKGGNFGWRTTEGFDCFDPSKNCDRAGLIDPVFDYGTEEGKSITGGYVYRGKKFPQLEGQYIYGDYVSSRIWALSYDENSKKSTNKLLTRLAGGISSFGEDEAGELYVVNYPAGKIEQLELK